jgi:hypothetical protein
MKLLNDELGSMSKEIIMSPLLDTGHIFTPVRHQLNA